MTASKLNWRLALFSGFFLMFFVYLGTWQLQRSHEKTEMIAAAEVQAKLPGVMLVPGIRVSVGEPLRVRGQFDPNRVFLIDNRVFEGRVGYEVLQLFEAEDGQNVLVNRGFVAGERTRSNLPEVPVANSNTQLIRGHAYLTELIAPADNVAGASSPWVIQVAKPKLLEPVAGVDLFSFVLRLEEVHPDALPRYWPVTIMTPERHFGYAITWYLMAFAVLAAFVFSSRADLKEVEHE